MTDALTLQGSIEEATVPELIRGVIRAGDSALLEIKAEGLESTACFRDGRLVFASTDDPDLRLPEMFLRSGQIDAGQFENASQKAAGRNAGGVLCDLGYIGSDELIRGVEKQVREIMIRIVGLRTGEYLLTFGEAVPRGFIRLQIPADRIILDGIARIDRWSRISAGIRNLDSTVRRTPGQDSRLYSLELTDDENGIFSITESPFTVREICRMSYLSNFDTCRVVWGLLTINLLEEIRPSTDSEASRAEGVGRLSANFNAAYTAMYRIVFGRIGEEIQDFLVDLVADLPPEMGRLLRGIDLTEGGRVDAARLEANLQAEKPADLELAAQEVLNELLYQWIFHVKKKFGAEVERDVTAALNSMKQG